MRISLNLATRPYADIGPALKRLRIAMAVLAVLAIGLGLGLRAVHQSADAARAAEQQVQNRIDGVNHERLGYQAMMQEPANAELIEQVNTLNQLFDEKTFSWTLAMEDLETVLPSGVQVTSLDPSRDTDTGRITLKLHVVGAHDRSDELVQNLEHSRHFLLPRIVGESAESTGGPGQRLEPVSAANRFTFELLADYNPAATADDSAGIKQEEARLADGPAPAAQPLPSAQAAASRVLPRRLPGRLPYTGPGRSPSNRVPHPGGTR